MTQTTRYLPFGDGERLSKGPINYLNGGSGSEVKGLEPTEAIIPAPNKGRTPITSAKRLATMIQGPKFTDSKLRDILNTAFTLKPSLYTDKVRVNLEGSNFGLTL